MSRQRFCFSKLGVVSLFFSALFCFGPAFSALGESLVIDADSQYRFADQLFAERKYPQAIQEYERFIHFFPEDDRIQTAGYRIGMSFFHSEQYEKAIAAFVELIDGYSGNGHSLDHPVTRAYFRISEASLRTNATGQAVANLRNLILLTDSIPVQDEAYFRLGWIFLESGNREQSAVFFGEINEEGQERYRLKTISEELNRMNEIPKKNPTLAGVLSIIPGAGYLYGERYRDGLTAFLLNGGLIASAYYAFDNENPALGAVISFVELGFYAGQIYGAIAGIHKYNRDHTRRFIENLKRNAQVELSSGPRGEGFALNFHYDF